MLQRLKTLSIFLILLLVVSVSVSGVAEANNAPTTVGTIPSESVKVGGGAIAIEVDGYFSDPDDDELVFAAGSSDTGIATVSVSGATVAIAPVAEGTVTITVDAIDPGGLLAKQSVSVTVRPQNRDPVVDSSIPDETLTVGGSVGEVDFSLHFSDPDGDALTYGAASADTAIATVSVSDAWLTITPVAAGTVTISTTATDTENASTTHTFSVTVNPPNEPPTATVIPSQTIKYGATATVNLDTYFTDPEGETLTYTATASDTSIITVSVSSATLTISTVNIGTAGIDITATDPGGKFAFQTVNVSVISNNNAPVAIQIPDKTVYVNQNFTVALGSYFTDADGDAMTYTASSNTTYKATVSLSGATLTVNGVEAGSAEISVTATDSRGDSASQTFGVTVNDPPSQADAVPGLSSDELSQLGALINYDTLIFNELYNGSDDANDWLELRNVSAADLPLDDWHLSILIGDGNVVGTFPPSTVIPAGGVLLVTHTKRVGTAEASVLSVAVETFALPQEEFALILQGPSGIGDLAVNYFQAETEFASETAPVLTVDTVWHRNQPIVSGYLAEAWSKSTTQDGLGTPGYRHSSEAADLNNDGTVDILDLVLVASQFGTNGTPAADLNNDGTVNIQDLVLIANAVNDIAAAPGAQQSQASVVKNWLQLARQHATGVAQTSIPEGFSYARGIQVLAQLAQAFVPEATALLANYPNPFNPETWIPYQLSEAADVTVRIYAADGSVVRTLALGHQEAGMYHNRSQAAYWDGRNVFGETVASGLYFYTLVAGEFTATRRMLILK